MLSAYMRFPGWSTGGPASLLVGSRPRTQIHTKCYCTECIPPIHFAYTHSLDGTVLLMVRDRYGIAPGMSIAQTNKNIVASCLCWYGKARDRYGIAPGVTQTNKQTPNERAWKLRALRYAFMLFCLAHRTCDKN